MQIGSKVGNPRDMGRTVSNALGYAPEEDEFDPSIDDFVVKERNYLHFDLPLTEDARKSFSISSEQMARHSFWPLLGFLSVERRVKKDKFGVFSVTEKERPIKFGSHVDAAIYAGYAEALSQQYERHLKESSFDSSVLAYRKGLGDNIDQAKSLFAEISAKRECVAIALDISGFFDHIRHDVLKENLCQVIGCTRLSRVDFKFFSRMTHFEWVNSDDLRDRLGRIYGRNGRICTSEQFRKYVRGTKPSLIKYNDLFYGIPQGTPLSGLYANISMIAFDNILKKFTDNLGGSYRRYSDDIAIILPKGTCPKKAVDFVTDVLAQIGLNISDKKTEIRVFDVINGQAYSEKPFQYLGFTFDGSKVLIRNSSLNRYYAKMEVGVRSKLLAAKKLGIDPKDVFLRQLYQRYTHFGKSRNFPRYAYRAADKFNSGDIRRQMSGHMKIFKSCLRKNIEQIF